MRNVQSTLVKHFQAIPKFRKMKQQELGKYFSRSQNIYKWVTFAYLFSNLGEEYIYTLFSTLSLYLYNWSFPCKDPRGDFIYIIK